jgi:hypothetical protein
MYIKDFTYNQQLAMVGVLETIKDEYKELDPYANEIFDEVHEEIGESNYNNLVIDFKKNFPNQEEFKKFLLDLNDSEAISIIHDLALGVIPFESGDDYTIVDFIEENFEEVFGDPDPDLDETQKFLLMYWLDYLHLIPESAYDEESEEYILDLWVDINEEEFESLFEKIPTVSELTEEVYESKLKELSQQVNAPEVKTFIVETLLSFSNFDLEEDVNDFPLIQWLIEEWNIEIEEDTEED